MPTRVFLTDLGLAKNCAAGTPRTKAARAECEAVKSVPRPRCLRQRQFNEAAADLAKALEVALAGWPLRTTFVGWLARARAGAARKGR